jgi:lysophospholipase L1-like esterase
LGGHTTWAKPPKGNSFFGQPVPGGGTGKSQDPNKNTALLPVPKLEEAGYDWQKRHEQILALNKTAKPKVVLIGDSITHFWGGEPEGHIVNGADSWQAHFGADALNLGFAWDRTQNVLWRLDHGEFDSIRPATAILNIGMCNLIATENARANTPAEIAEAILAICNKIRSKSFQTRIVVMGVFPRGNEATGEMREPTKALNALLAKTFRDKAGILFLDIGPQLLEKNGSLSKALMVDDTHPNNQGYELWATALAKAGVKF